LCCRSACNELIVKSRGIFQAGSLVGTSGGAGAAGRVLHICLAHDMAALSVWDFVAWGRRRTLTEMISIARVSRVHGLVVMIQHLLLDN
jgi:hypothetical protein